MGTNFYAVLPVKKKVTKNLEKAIELINNTPYDIDAIEAEIFEVKEEIDKNRIHLGKRSGGWVFDWDANDLKYYEPVLESIKNFIESSNASIVDENVIITNGNGIDGKYHKYNISKASGITTAKINIAKMPTE